jgi:hypothetical protein
MNGTEEPRAEPDLIPDLVAGQYREHRRDERGEQNHQAQVTGHLRPWAMS